MENKAREVKTTGFFKNWMHLETNDKQLSEVFKPTRVVHTIEDCMITKDDNPVAQTEQYKNLKEFFGDALPQYLDSYQSMFKDCTGGEVPVLTYHDYLKNLKDVVSMKHPNIFNLKRMFTCMSNGIHVGSALITNKTPGRYILVSEVYQEGNLIQSAEYDLEDVLINYNRLMNEEATKGQVLGAPLR